MGGAAWTPCRRHVAWGLTAFRFAPRNSERAWAAGDSAGDGKLKVTPDPCVFTQTETRAKTIAITSALLGTVPRAVLCPCAVPPAVPRCPPRGGGRAEDV
jgi:hypothetical protein